MVISENPCAHATKPKKNRAAGDIKHFTPEQTKIFLDALDREYEYTYKAHDRIDDTGKGYHVNEYKELRSIDLQFKVFFYIALFGGLRRSEILALTWQDIDFVGKTIDVSKSVCYVNKIRTIKQPKTRNSVRTVTMPDSLMSVLKKYQIEQMSAALALGDKWNNSAGLLFTQWNGKPMDVSTPYHKFKHIIAAHNASIMSDARLTDEERKAQLLPDIPLHGLRHTSATLLIADNKDVITVANRLGHAQPSTTMNIYAHALKKKDEEASDTFERVFGSRNQDKSELQA
ncbi:MAG: site-specific integrase [Clostridiales bacterium]|nr:site-specific integrase [Clostridiales bacterium]